MSDPIPEQQRGSGTDQPLVRRVWFTMIMHPATGWTRVGRAYASRNSASEWIPFVRGAWRGLQTKVAQCTLRWVNGQLDDKSRRTLDKKFNMDAPNKQDVGTGPAAGTGTHKPMVRLSDGESR